MKKHIIFFLITFLTSFGIFALVSAGLYEEYFLILLITGALSIISVNVLIYWSAKSNFWKQ